MKSKNFKILFLSIILLSLIIPIIFAHEEEEGMMEQPSVDPVKQIFFLDSVSVIEWAFAAVLILIIVSIFKGESMTPFGKKIFFVAMVALIAFSTLYLSGETVYRNLISQSGGPIHWHADYEIWVCGEKIELMHSEGLTDKVGSELMHNHNDSRIHIEGTIVDLKDATVGKFFEAIGDKFTNDEIMITSSDGTIIDKHNGDLCNGKPGSLKFFVNGTPNDKFDDYIIKPFSTVPPGDVLRIEYS